MQALAQKTEKRNYFTPNQSDLHLLLIKFHSQGELNILAYHKSIRPPFIIY